MSEPETIYLYRRKGQPAWATCERERFDEMQSMHMFDTKTAYSALDYDQLRTTNQRLEGLLQRVQVSMSLDDTEWGYSGTEKYTLLADIKAALSTNGEVTE